MYRSCLVVLLAVFAAIPTARADGPLPGVRAHAVRRTGAIAIDGRLDEPAWQAAPVQRGFVQRFPSDAAAPTVDTRFAILYDDEAVFVAVWADDPRPDLIRALLTRRDVDAPADSVIVAFDSYHDRRTAYAFQLNAAGVQRDMVMFDDSNQDDTWDAVWTGNVARTASGWTAEYRIPLSQLRFASVDVQEWGLQLIRTVGRTGEQDAWSPWPRSAPQVVSKFGVVDGIDHLKSTPRLELVPYVTGGFARSPVDDGDPFNKQWGLRKGVGLDVKYGLGPAFTISATINPDFGQVEADPSKVNLSANELFFAEKRPFFLEGADLFRLPIGNSDNSVEGGFYSRRIGGAPAEPDDYDFLQAPSSTTIYGAAKLSGKTASGWSVGVLDAVTSKESARVEFEDVRTEPVVAPLTNYAIARLKRDFGDGATSVGMSATAVNRKLDGTGLESTLHDQAYTGGLQLSHRWWDNAWTANVSAIGSWVHGTAEAISDTQQDSVHYFQRPDAKDVHLDETRTSLSGADAKWMIGRLGDTKHWRFGFGGDLRTPGLELNDAGFQFNSDRDVPFLLLQYRENTPSDHLLNWNLSTDVFIVHNFEPRVLDYGWEYNAYVQFANYWGIAAGGNVDDAKWNVNALRGGPTLRGNLSSFNYLNIQTDTRKPVWFYLNGNGGGIFGSGEIEGGVELGATIQARSNLDIFLAPSIYKRNDPMQYIDEEPDLAGVAHYIFGRIHQTDVAMTVRMNWTFSPHLALQAYAQPYISSGNYNELKDLDNPGARRYADRFHVLGRDETQLVDGTYHVMRATGAAFSFDQPDFNFRQLRSTVVLRWEYRPGSTVFAIWSHGQTSDQLDDGRFRFGRDLSDLGTAATENIVMVKANYWIGL
jgi:hypothetical protein